MFRKKKSRVRTWLSVDARIPETCLSYLSCYFMITHLKIVAPFYGWGLTASWLQSYYEEIVFTPKFPEIPGMYSSDQPRKDVKLSRPWNHLFVYQPSYYQIQIKVTISQTESIMTLNCELRRSEFCLIWQAYHKIVENLFTLHTCRPNDYIAKIWCFSSNSAFQYFY